MTGRQLPRDVAAVLDALLAEPGRPRLTWYGSGGERVELSGAVLGNWVTKTTNLLVEEFDAAPGTVLAVDLPGHWRTVVWALGSWRAGATVDFRWDDEDAAPPTAGADVLVTHRPGAVSCDGEVVAVALPALARSFPGELPAGAIDAASAVMTYGDRLGWVPPTDGEAPATPGLRHADLVDAAVASLPGLGGAVPGPRVLATAAGARATALLTLGALAAGGSVVLLDPEVGAELAADQRRAERLVAAERITIRR